MKFLYRFWRRNRHETYDNRENKRRKSEPDLQDFNGHKDLDVAVLNYEEFQQKYNSMETSKKWVLSTGTVVEDKLYEFGMKCTWEHLSHSFILDPDDKNYLNEGIFTTNELDEIRSFQAKPLPEVPKELSTYLNSFRPRITADLRQLVFRQDAMDQDFDRQKDFDRDWIRNIAYNLLREYEADSLKKDMAVIARLELYQ